MGTISRKGTSLAIFGSTFKTTKLLIIDVDTSHQKIKFITYLAPEFECVWLLRKVQRWWEK